MASTSRRSGKTDSGEQGTASASTTAPAASTASSGAGAPANRGGTASGGTRFSAMWVGATIAAVVLVLLLIFIVQNNNDVQIRFLGLRGSLPLGVALLFGAVAGVLLVAVPGYGRIIQLRRRVKRKR